MITPRTPAAGVQNPRTGRPYKPGLFYYDYAVELVQGRGMPRVGLQVLPRVKLVQLAASAEEALRAGRVRWSYPEYREPGRVFETAPARQWVGLPGYGLRLHSTLVLTVHPPTEAHPAGIWSVARGVSRSLSTQQFLSQYSPVRVSLDHRGTGRDNRIHAVGEPPLFFDIHQHYFFDEEGHLLPEAHHFLPDGGLR